MTGSDRLRVPFRRKGQFGETEEHHHDRIRSELEQATGLIVKISREPVTSRPYHAITNGSRIAGYTAHGLALSEPAISVDKPTLLGTANAFQAAAAKLRSAQVKP